nr:hypothetical protein [Tanacetum cinerariifolium]
MILKDGGEEEGEGSRHPSEPQPPPSTTQPTNEEPILNVVSSSYQKTQTPRKALTKVTKSERVPTPSYDLPLLGVHTPGSDEERFKQHELTGNVQQQSNDPHLSRGHTVGSEESKTAQDLVITRLKLRVKKLEKNKKKARTPQPLKRRLFKVRVESSAEENLDEEDPSKQEGVSAQGEAHSQEDQFEDQLGVLSAAKVLADAARKNVQTYTRRRRAVSTGSGGISTASRLFSTAEKSVSTAGASMPVSTAGIVQEVNINIPLLVAVKDKAVRLQEELDEEERQRMARIHEATQSFTEEELENIRARVKADEELTQRLQAKERNTYNEVDQAKMLVDLINQRKRYFVA